MDNRKQRKEIEKILLVRINSLVRVKTGHPRSYCLPWRLKYIESLLKQEGKKTKIIDLLVTVLPLNALLNISVSWKPDLLIISSVLTDCKLTLKYANLVKEKIRNIFIICVGSGPTTKPTEYLFRNSPIDLILPGEAEFEIISLLKKIEKGYSAEVIRNSYFQNNKNNNEIRPILSSELDNLPFPVYSKGELQRYSLIYPVGMNKQVIWGQILSSRGCFHRCIFCSPMLRYSYGTKIRLRSAKNVVNEIEYLLRKGANAISFEDDDFTASKEHVISICREIQKRDLKIKWISHARVDEVTPKLLKIMKENGCILLRFGIESGSQRIINILNKCDTSINWIEKSKKVFREAKTIGIMTNAMFIIGNPNETEEDIWKSIKLAKELNPDMIQVSFFVPYPGSFAYELFKGKIEKHSFFYMYHYALPPVNLSNICDRDLVRLQKVFYGKFLFRFKFIITHLRKYTLFYLHNPRIVFALLKAKKILF